MSRYRGAKCRLCRREGVKLFLKGEKCLGKSCPMEARNFPPGQHGARRTKLSDYGVQLREKQKVKRMYGMGEKQFRNEFKKVSRLHGVTGTNLLIALESRLDNIVYRLGFATSKDQSRQLVLHGHVEVNGKRVNIPSYHCRVNDEIRIAEKSREVPTIAHSLESGVSGNVPVWLEVDKPKMQGFVRATPSRDEIPVVCNEQLIVELYSK